MDLAHEHDNLQPSTHKVKKKKMFILKKEIPTNAVWIHI